MCVQCSIFSFLFCFVSGFLRLLFLKSLYNAGDEMYNVGMRPARTSCARFL